MLFGLPTKMKYFGSCNVRAGNVLEKPFQRCITHPKYIKFAIAKRKKENLQLFNDCRLGWSKDPQWENDWIVFLHSFLLVMFTRCTPNRNTKGAISDTIIVEEGMSHCTCLIRSLYLSFTKCGFREQNEYFTIHNTSHRNK